MRGVQGVHRGEGGKGREGRKWGGVRVAVAGRDRGLRSPWAFAEKTAQDTDRTVLFCPVSGPESARHYCCRTVSCLRVDGGGDCAPLADRLSIRPPRHVEVLWSLLHLATFHANLCTQSIPVFPPTTPVRLRWNDVSFTMISASHSSSVRRMAKIYSRRLRSEYAGGLHTLRPMASSCLLHPHPVTENPLRFSSASQGASSPLHCLPPVFIGKMRLPRCVLLGGLTVLALLQAQGMHASSRCGEKKAPLCSYQWADR